MGPAPGALDSALGGRGQVVLVAGEPGIGKTALLGALADGAADRSVSWRGASAGTTRWPHRSGRGHRCCVSWATPPTLSEARLPAVPTRRSGDGTVDRFALFGAVGTLLIGMAEAHGLVVVLDDLHWADEATLALLSFLSRHVPRSRC